MSDTTRGSTTQWLTSKEAAAYARVHLSTLRRAIHARKLLAFKINGGRSARLRKEDVDKWLGAVPTTEVTS